MAVLADEIVVAIGSIDLIVPLDIVTGAGGLAICFVVELTDKKKLTDSPKHHLIDLRFLTQPPLSMCADSIPLTMSPNRKWS